MHLEWTKDGGLVADGTEVAHVDVSFWKERATVTMAGVAWEFTKEAGARLVGRAPGQPEIAAERTSFWKGTWQVRTTTGEVLDIARAGMFGGGYRISAPAGEVAVVKSASGWSTRPAADLPDGVPLVDAVFVFWVIYLLMQRDSSAAATAASGQS